jgi:hypothetical protein
MDRCADAGGQGAPFAHQAAARPTRLVQNAAQPGCVLVVELGRPVNGPAGAAMTDVAKHGSRPTAPARSLIVLFGE